jgi:Ca2+-binding RTX toxin-like protein
MSSPTLILLPSVSFNEADVNAAPQDLSPTYFLAPNMSYGGWRLSVFGLGAEDRITLTAQGDEPGQVGVTPPTRFEPGEVRYGGVVIGTISGGIGEALTVSFNADAQAVMVEAVIDALAYANVSDTPAATRTLTVDLVGPNGERANNATPSFVDGGVLFDGGQRPATAIADFNYDGLPDFWWTDDGTFGIFRFFNTGTGFTPADPFGASMPDGSSGFLESGQTVYRNTPYKLVPPDPIGGLAVPTAADLTGDGNLDLILGNEDGTLTFHVQRIDSRGVVQFGEYPVNPSNAGPFAGIDVGDFAAPAFTDLDGDGDLDLVVGSLAGTLATWRNDGGTFVALTGTANPFDGIDVGAHSVPTFIDLDGDGRLDLVVGSYDTGLSVFRNTGTGFVALTGSANPLNGLVSGTYLTPSAGDLDGDGRIDLIIGKVVDDFDGSIVWLRNTTGVQTVTVTVLPENDAPVFTSGPSGIEVAPGTAGTIYAAAAYDPDGTAISYGLSGADATLFAIDAATGAVRFAGGAPAHVPGGANEYAFTVLASDGVNVTTQDATVTVTGPAAATLQGFGGTVTFAENTVNAGAVSLAPQATLLAGELLAGGTLTVSGLLAEDRVTIVPEGAGGPAAIGFDGSTITFDGAAIGTAAGGVGTDFVISLATNASDAAVAALVQRIAYANVSDTPTASRSLTLSASGPLQADAGALFLAPGGGEVNPLSGISQGLNFDPFGVAVIDLDNDGLMDVVAGETVTASLYGRVRSWRNTGDGFEELTGSDNPFAAVAIAQGGSFTFADADGDGRDDLVLMNLSAAPEVWRNTGTGFARLAHADNPLLPLRHAGFAQDVTVTDAIYGTAFGDFSGDGRTDVVMGLPDGTLAAWQGTPGGYVALEGAANPFAGMDFGERAQPALLDVNGDGRLDLVVANSGDQLQVRISTPAGWMVPSGDAADPFQGLELPALFEPNLTQYFGPGSGTGALEVRLDVADMDGDGRQDLLVFGSDGNLAFLRNTASSLSVTVEVTAQADGPPITSPSAVTVPGLADYVVYQATAAEPGVLWSLSGADARSLTIDAAGAVRFAAPIPFVQGNDNRFDITVHARSAADPALRFIEATGAANPFAETGLAGYFEKSFVSARIADLDGDGRRELLGIVFDAPPGASSTSPSFPGPTAHVWTEGANGWVQLPDAEAGLPGLRPFAAVDLVGDSLPEVVAFSGQELQAWRRTDAGYVALSANENPFDGIAFDPLNGGPLAPPSFADIDGDGDQDLVAAKFGAEDAGTGVLPILVGVWENTGSGATELSDATNPFAGLRLDLGVGQFPGAGSPGRASQPLLGDLDGDGDLDLVALAGRADGSWVVRTWLNDGAGLTELTGAANPFDGVTVLQANIPYPPQASLADVNGDGRLDLLVTQNFNFDSSLSATGDVRVFLNQTAPADTQDVTITLAPPPAITTPVTPSFTAPAQNPFAAIGVGFYSAPAFADLDGDGLVDLVVGSGYEGLHALRQTADGSFAAFADDPVAGLPVGFAATPVFADLDGDGDLDLAVGGGFGSTLGAFERLDDGSFVAFAENPFTGLGNFAAIALADYDKDGRLELMAGSFGPGLAVFERGADGVFAPTANPFGALGAFTDVKPAFADLDGDGRLDLVAGTLDGTVQIFRQMEDGSFAPFAVDPLPGAGRSMQTAPAFGDIDGDGDLDLVVGAEDGQLTVLRNDSRIERIVAENSSGVVLAPAAQGGFGTLAWSLGGADAGAFVIDAASGAIRFAQNPDFETPTDTGADNIYDLVLNVTDAAGFADSRAVRIAVTDLADGPSGSVSFTGANDTLTAQYTLRDNSGLGPITLHWQASANGGASWTDIAVGETFTPGTGQVNRLLRVEARYTDGTSVPRALASAEQAQVGNGGANSIIAGGAVTAIFGLGGNDVLTAAATATELFGGSGNDILTGGAGDDRQEGGSGNDTLVGNDGNDTLNGGAGNDLVDGGAGDDVILVRGSEALGDTIIGGTGIDTLRVIAGTGTLTMTRLVAGDLEVLDASGEIIQGTSAADTLDLSGFTQVLNFRELRGRGGDDMLVGSDNDDILDGGDGNDTLIGNAGRDTLLGGAGSDTLRGGEGDDTLNGGAGNDIVDGGAGDDVILVRGSEALGDTIIGGTGIDTLRVIAGSGTLTLAQLIAGDLEILDASGEIIQGTSGADTLDLSGFTQVLNLNVVRGRGGNDLLVGSANGETLDGGDGNDTIIGGGGNDILIGGSGLDVFVFGHGFGDDRVIGFDANPTGGQDLLDLRPLGITAANFANEVTIDVVGTDTLVTVGGQGSILLAGVSGLGANVITITDFLLA